MSPSTIARILAVICTAFISSQSAPAFVQSEKPGCKPFGKTITKLQNSTLIRFSGGECGGKISISVRLTGSAQYKNEFDKFGRPKDPKKYASVSMQLMRKTDNKDVCSGQRTRDQGFNDFSLSCEVEDSLNPYDSEAYTMSYQTNNVSRDNPGPPLGLQISYRYEPDL
jgi:hypothetical protein